MPLRLCPRFAPVRFGWALGVGAALIGCGEQPGAGAAAAGAANAAGSVSSGGLNGAGASAGGATFGGANAGGANLGGATSAGMSAGGANAGGANAGGATAGGNANGGSANGGNPGGGAGGVPAAAPSGITVTSHDLAVSGGSVFNVADDYFNDGLIPATPVANFGCQSQITTLANDDGSLDIAWLDYTNGKGKPWAVSSPGSINITHVDAALGSATTQPSGISSYKLLGFAKDAAGAFYLAYNKDHPFKTAAQGDQNNLNGNELHVTKLSGGTPGWDQLIFGNQDNSQEATLGDPGGAASGVLGYDATNQKLVLYVGHSMMWTGVRHQAGFLRLLNPGSGAVLPPSGDDIIHFGAGWWYSHNFNQRLLIDGGNYYVLAHGDAYSRQLGFARWSVNGYTNKNDTDFNESYFAIAGSEGDNNTSSQTGQFIKMPDGRFLMVHTTSQGRSARDVRLIFASGTTGKADPSAVWLTTNQGTVQATMPKLELLGDYVLVTYALWDSTKKHELTWYAALLDASLAIVAAPKVVPSVEFVDAAPLFRFKGGPDAGKVGWVSGNALHTLSVRVASLAY
jgi:hypothetical protein